MNKQILLAARPTGFPKPTDFRLVERPIPEPVEGQFLVGISYLSVDPYTRGRMNATRSYADPQKLDEVMGGGAVGRVLASHHPGFAECALGVPGDVAWGEHRETVGQDI
jgi:NADPH-dependent curcumin reductase CurA